VRNNTRQEKIINYLKNIFAIPLAVIYIMGYIILFLFGLLRSIIRL